MKKELNTIKYFTMSRRKEHKTALIGFLREIKEGYNKNEMTLIIKKNWQS